MSRLVAVTREVSPRFAECELTHIGREPIDVDRARDQHAAYCRLLEELGCELLSLPTAADLPDCVFIEDTALVLDELAVVTRPGAASRRPETAAVAEALFAFRELAFLRPPATLDGGDVLVRGRRIWVGRSTRSNDEGIRQLADLLAPFGYDVDGVELEGCLHLKSAVTALDPERVLVNPRWVDPEVLGEPHAIAVADEEPDAANALALPGSEPRLIFPTAHPRTRERLESAGFTVDAVDISEAAKAEGGVTCCSLLFPA